MSISVELKLNWLLRVICLCWVVACGFSQGLTLKGSLGEWPEDHPIKAWEAELSALGLKADRISDVSLLSTRVYKRLKDKQGATRFIFRYRIRLVRSDNQIQFYMLFRCKEPDQGYRKCRRNSGHWEKKFATKLFNRMQKKFKRRYKKILANLSEEGQGEPLISWSSLGEVGLEFRYFKSDDDERTVDAGTALLTRLEIKGETDRFFGRLKVLSRSDQQDQSRQVNYVEEGYITYEQEAWSLSVGSKVLNWSATEAFHPADIINSKNYDGDFENPEKLGEPMVHFTYLLDIGNLDFYYMPIVLSPIYPQSSNRLSLLPSSTTGGRTFWFKKGEGISGGDYTGQWAMRGSFNFDGIDFALMYVDHMDRQQPSIYLDSNFVVHPVHLPVRVFASTFQMVVKGFVFKGEAAFRDFDDSYTDESLSLSFTPLDHYQVALGAEYGLTHKGGYDSTFIFEIQKYGGVGEDEKVGLGIFQDDILLGYRLAENDQLSTEWFFSYIKDLSRDSESIYQFHWSQRLSDVWKIKSGFRMIDAPVKASTAEGLEVFHEDNQVFLQLSRFF